MVCNLQAGVTQDKNLLAKTDISYRMDYRFTFEENWFFVLDIIEEANERNCKVYITNVFDFRGKIIGWKISGWNPPKGESLYGEERID